MEHDQQHHPYDELVYHKIKQMLAYCEVKQQSLDKLPLTFIQFLNERGLDKKQLTVPIPRYVRIKPSYPIQVQELAQKLNINFKQIVQIEQHFWAINPKAKINHCELYQSGILYGMDYSSSIPVKCLQIQQDNRILELCCAPGNKSMLIADTYPSVHITGVQINVNRANVMNSLIKKYKLDKSIQVVVADGLKYGLRENEQPYDRVLVDSQCTHEGSLKHIYKFFKQQQKQGEKAVKIDHKLSRQQQRQFKKNNTNPYTSQIKKTNEWTKQDFQERFLDRYKLSQLNKLQFGLLQNGFKLLKEGGIIVYSTCSFDYLQNQKIIQDFLQKEPLAQLLDAAVNLNTPIGWKYGKLQGTIRLSPSISQCGGMFVAKLLKRQA